ncbi:MAG: 1-deoxy-D-xylulose-5-phosphate reductoisomerase [Clostridiales bacterium]|nr:1-deoxy-D-xylulose-5-phosphate reductoisomerase [Clostridiales bacterium]
MKKNIAILGSTGSIGTQTLDVVERLGNIRVTGLTAQGNIDKLEDQIRKFRPSYVAVVDEEKAEELKFKIRNTDTKVFSGTKGLVEVATGKEIDTVVTSVVGNSGIVPTIEAIKAGKDIALANKETLVSAGNLVMGLVKKKKVHLYPVDSEHSAIFQCLRGNENNSIRRILLTASGGPFRGKTRKDLEHVTVAETLNHPNWSMGKKVTIDSAGLMNKGLEMIEAKWLFDVEVNQIEVLIHPQSIVHSAVEYTDGAVIAQLGEPDMRLPIQYALTYPERVATNLPTIDFEKRSQLTFEKPDMETFRCLGLAYRAIQTGGTMPAVMNAANEIAVEKFLNEKIGFLQIPDMIEKTMDAYTVKYEYDVDDLVNADQWARKFATNIILK